MKDRECRNRLPNFDVGESDDSFVIRVADKLNDFSSRVGLEKGCTTKIFRLKAKPLVGNEYPIRFTSRILDGFIHMEMQDVANGIPQGNICRKSNGMSPT